MSPEVERRLDRLIELHKRLLEYLDELNNTLTKSLNTST